MSLKDFGIEIGEGALARDAGIGAGIEIGRANPNEDPREVPQKNQSIHIIKGDTGVDADPDADLDEDERLLLPVRKLLDPAECQKAFVIGTILPVREVHILSGSSGSGKTMWLFQMLIRWLNSASILGYPAFPRPFAYIACERSRTNALATFARTGAEHDQQVFPIISTAEEGIWNLEEVIARAADEVPGLEFIVLDGVTSLVPGNPAHTTAVNEFFNQAVKLMRSRNITILATTSAAKLKADERYLSPRQRVMGAAAWGARSGTTMILEETNPEDPLDGRRTLHLLPQQTLARILHFMLDTQGRFVLDDEDRIDIDEFGKQIFQLPMGSVLTTGIIREIYSNLGMSQATAYRYVKKYMDEGSLRRIKNGQYAVTRTN